MIQKLTKDEKILLRYLEILDTIKVGTRVHGLNSGTIETVASELNAWSNGHIITAIQDGRLFLIAYSDGELAVKILE